MDTSCSPGFLALVLALTLLGPLVPSQFCWAGCARLPSWCHLSPAGVTRQYRDAFVKIPCKSLSAGEWSSLPCSSPGPQYREAAEMFQMVSHSKEVADFVFGTLCWIFPCWAVPLPVHGKGEMPLGHNGFD